MRRDDQKDCNRDLKRQDRQEKVVDQTFLDYDHFVPLLDDVIASIPEAIEKNYNI